MFNLNLYLLLQVGVVVEMLLAQFLALVRMKFMQ